VANAAVNIVGARQIPLVRLPICLSLGDQRLEPAVASINLSEIVGKLYHLTVKRYFRRLTSCEFGLQATGGLAPDFAAEVFELGLQLQRLGVVRTKRDPGRGQLSRKLYLLLAQAE
jgi:hypothetical protein